MSDVTIRPADVSAAEYRAARVWRESGPVGDLRRRRDETPEATAIAAYRSGAGVRRVSCGEWVERHCQCHRVDPDVLEAPPTPADR
jgi:hypothetical protein